ncbi:30S ribosome-binding factor RbfA [Candidatus Bipolaricaulota bacterium]|nr:30S ribosome-binding factor RbfA [Candidatus Bipolaricaulota bacterium]HHR85552.1 30S ribosome-binding factor RbfA [Candidatus Acetothermia bacterium]
MTDGRGRARTREEIKRELSTIVEFEARDPIIREAFPTVMDVRLSVDARYAKVYIAVGATTASKEEIVEAFARDRGFFRTQLARRLTTRYTPQLEFVLDETVEWAMRLEKLLEDEDDELPAD